MQLLVGTYSFPIAGVQSNGKGIYSVNFNCQTGEFSTPNLLAECKNPSSLAISADRKILFAGREVFEDQNPALVSFRLTEATSLTPASQLRISGELPCHLAFDPEHDRLASAQYWTGDVTISPVIDGTLQAASCLTRSGQGPNAARQESPHAHYVTFSDMGNVLHLVDLGTDSIVSHQLDANGNATQTVTVSTPAGSGPRHMVINGAETRAWVLCELDESLIILTRNGLGWVIESIQAGFVAPIGEDGSGAAIRLSPDESHVYISGRRQSQIAGFTASTGTQIGIFGCGGISPRDFIVTPDGGWIVSANQLSNSLTSLRRDSETGNLMLSGQSCDIGSPACLIVSCPH